MSVAPDLAVQKLLARKDAVRAMEVERVRWNLERHDVRAMRGRASFIDGHTVVERDEAGVEAGCSAEVIPVATGSMPHRPAELDFGDPAISYSDEILLIDRLPRRMAIFGAGVIGCEYACMLAAAGDPRHR